MRAASSGSVESPSTSATFISAATQRSSKFDLLFHGHTPRLRFLNDFCIHTLEVQRRDPENRSSGSSRSSRSRCCAPSDGGSVADSLLLFSQLRFSQLWRRTIQHPAAAARAASVKKFGGSRRILASGATEWAIQASALTSSGGRKDYEKIPNIQKKTKRYPTSPVMTNCFMVCA